MTDSDRIERAASMPPPLAVGGRIKRRMVLAVGPMGLGILGVQRGHHIVRLRPLRRPRGGGRHRAGRPERGYLAGHFDRDGGHSGRGDRAHHRPAGGCEWSPQAQSCHLERAGDCGHARHVQREERSQLSLDCADPAAQPALSFKSSPSSPTTRCCRRSPPRTRSDGCRDSAGRWATSAASSCC